MSLLNLIQSNRIKLTPEERKLVKTADCHCERNICLKCGASSSCRCIKPKTVITHKPCWVCDGRKAEFEKRMKDGTLIKGMA